MAKSKASYMKKQLEKNRRQKHEQKLHRKEERKKNAPGGALKDMLAYVNHLGEIIPGVPENKIE